MEQESEKKNEEKPGKIARDYQVIDNIGKYWIFLSIPVFQCKYLLKTNEAPCQ